MNASHHSLLSPFLSLFKRSLSPLKLAILCAFAVLMFLTYSHSKPEITSTDTSLNIMNYQQAKAINQAQYEQAQHEQAKNKHNPKMAQITRPTSLQDIEFPTEFTLDQNQRLIPSFAVRELFDHYLSTYGETELETILGLIQTEISEHLQEPAKSEALSLLKRYVDYKIALAEHSQTFSLSQDSSQPLVEQANEAQVALQTLRAQFFDNREYDQFFAQEDAQNAFMIEQLRISQDTSLTPEAKQQQLEMAAQLLPDAILESRTRVQQHAQLRTQISELQTQGANPDTIFSVREQALGTDAAHALAELDSERAQWQQRLNLFSEQRQFILEASMSEEDKNHAIDALVTEQFAVHEQKRVRAITRAGLLP